MPGRRCLAILLILAAAAPPVVAETYKWVDEKGVVNYSNKLPPGKVPKTQLVEERISIVAPDPSIGLAIAAMHARAARQAQYDEAEWLQRQRIMLAARPGAGYASCPYRTDCGMGYDPNTNSYYPYYAPAFVVGAASRLPPVFMQRSSFSSGGMGTMRSGRGSFR